MMGSEFIPKQSSNKLPPPPTPGLTVDSDQPVKTIGLPGVDPRHLRRFEAKKKELTGKSEKEQIKILEKMNKIEGLFVGDPEDIVKMGAGVVAETIVTAEQILETTKERKNEFETIPDEATKEEKEKLKKRIKDQKDLDKQRQKQSPSRRGGAHFGIFGIDPFRGGPKRMVPLRPNNLLK